MTFHSRPINAAPAQSTTTTKPTAQPTNPVTHPLPTQDNAQPTGTRTEPSTVPAPVESPISLSPAATSPSPPLPTSSSLAPPASVRDALLSCDAVCFDVDSTVLTEEGIDVLAAHLGKGAEVAALTSAAMNGGLPFQHALKQRLDLLQPSADSITDCLAAHPLSLTPGFLSLLHLLRTKQKQLFLVTGGFSQMLLHLLPALHIPATHIYANRLLFTPTGQYAGFDTSQPTSSSGGKAKAVAALMAQWTLRSVVMVGDGMTDVEARPPAACMVGYGGVVVREAVRKKADWFIVDWKQLMDVFETDEERRGREQRMQQEEKEEKEETRAEQRNAEKDADERKEQPAAPDAVPTAVQVSGAKVVDDTAADGVKKQRKQRSDKGVKRDKRKSTAEMQQAEQPQQGAIRQMSKEQRMAEAAKATSAIDTAMAEWTFLSSPAAWR